MALQNDNPKAVIERMEAIRGALEEEYEEALEATSDAFDWKHYVARHPVVVSLLAAGLGYLAAPAILPRRVKTVAQPAIRQTSRSLGSSILRTVVLSSAGLAVQELGPALLARLRSRIGAHAGPSQQDVPKQGTPPVDSPPRPRGKFRGDKQ